MSSSIHLCLFRKKLRDQARLFPENKSAIKGKVREALEDKKATDGETTED